MRCKQGLEILVKSCLVGAFFSTVYYLTDFPAKEDTESDTNAQKRSLKSIETWYNQANQTLENGTLDHDLAWYARECQILQGELEFKDTPETLSTMSLRGKLASLQTKIYHYQLYGLPEKPLERVLVKGEEKK